MMTGSVNARTAASGARTVITRAPFHAGARSSQQADPAQGDLHHLVDGLRRGKPGETQTAAMGGALDLIGPLAQQLEVRALGERCRRELSLEPGLGIPQPCVPGPVQRELLGSQ